MLAELHPLNCIKDERGALTEIWRMSSDHYGFGQAYITSCKQGVVKAWHRHRHQWDRWFCVRGHALVGLANGLVTQSLQLSQDNPQLLIIPAGIWHGFTPVGDCEETVILNLPSSEYLHMSPDEERSSLDTFSFQWNAKVPV
jgi:dTDP-4-dehydrorhamnose 3,5-epimerase